MDPVVTPDVTESLVNGHLLEYDTKGSPVDPDIISNCPGNIAEEKNRCPVVATKGAESSDPGNPEDNETDSPGDVHEPSTLNHVVNVGKLGGEPPMF